MIQRREFITLLAGAAATWPVTARAQQPAIPVVGFLRSTPSASFDHIVGALRKGLSEVGFVDGRSRDPAALGRRAG
jgi:putative tryptophan/tyrosine transport system substrate-binding protein